MARRRLPGLLWYLRSERARRSAADPGKPARFRLVRADGRPVASAVTMRFYDAAGAQVHECRRPADGRGDVDVVLPARGTSVLVDWSDAR